MSDNNRPAPKPKIRLRLSLGGNKVNSKSKSNPGSNATPAPTSRLDLGNTSTSTGTSKKASNATTAAILTSKSSSSSNAKNTISAPPPVHNDNANRGKELPAAVRAAQRQSSIQKKLTKQQQQHQTSKDDTNKVSATSSVKSTAINITTNLKGVAPATAASFASVTKIKVPISSTNTKAHSTVTGKGASVVLPLPAHNRPFLMVPPMPIPHPPSMSLNLLQSKATLKSVPMTAEQRVTCLKLLNSLRRRHLQTSTAGNAYLNWFLKPVSDPNIANDYRNKIPNPCDIVTLTNRLRDKASDGTYHYKTIDAFVLDLRSIFANALRYNSIPKDKIRVAAVSVLDDVERLLSFFIAHPEAPNLVYPPLLYCWKQCLEKIDVVLAMKNRSDNLQTAFYFLHPVSYYFGGSFPVDYLEKIGPNGEPMDFGTTVTKLLTGVHQSVGAFAADCRKTCENCKKYYANKIEGAIFVEQSDRLMDVLGAEVGALVVSDQQRGVGVPNLPPPPIRIPIPTKEFMKTIMRDLRNTSYTSRISKAIMRAMGPFEKPVPLDKYPDYKDYVHSPMELETIDRKIEQGAYRTPDDFEYDMLLIFDNCEKYNIPKKHIDIVNMSKHGLRAFKRLFSNNLKKLESGHVFSSSALTKKQNDIAKCVKRSAILLSSASSTTSIPAATKRLKKSELGAVKSMNRSTQPPLGQAQPSLQNNLDPAPLNVVIERVKQIYAPRRSPKNFEPWEVACLRIITMLLKHPWLTNPSAPKFIFHVPVVTLFPEIADAYQQKITKPMDLMTCESKLFHGGLYESPQHFVDELQLVFSNAITFNQAGHDEGDPMSCAYFEAAQHLLFYIRMLSLENLSGFIISDTPDSADRQPTQGAFTGWQLTKTFKQDAKREMEGLVMNIALEKSDIYDRFTWWEQECEKVLKALRHQSDLRYMTYFIHTVYPADYAAFVAKPLDWNDCNRNLQDRMYDTIGSCIEDVRLIFSNALKYNARAEGTDTVSGLAFAAAQFMSAKLEAAVDRMILTVSERLGREKVDTAIQRREHIAAEIAEEEKARAEGHDIEAWRAEREQKKAEEEAKKQQVLEMRQQTIKINLPQVSQRKPLYHDEYNADSDFDPFEEDDDTHHEQAYIEAVKRERTLFIKQQKDRKVATKIAYTVGIGVFARMATKIQAKKSHISSNINDSNVPTRKIASSLSSVSVCKAVDDTGTLFSKPSKIKGFAKGHKITFAMKTKMKNSMNIVPVCEGFDLSD